MPARVFESWHGSRKLAHPRHARNNTPTPASAKEAEEAQTLLRVRELREEADLLEASLNDIELVEALVA